MRYKEDGVTLLHLLFVYNKTCYACADSLILCIFAVITINT